MIYTQNYLSPLGKIILTSDGENLTGLYFEGQKYFPENLGEEKISPIFEKTFDWLNIYFSGENPKFFPKIKMSATNFRKIVWKVLLQIPYGETKTYGEIAKKINSSAQAVGGAVGHNPISIIIPCHRVVGSGGNLTGYAGGIEKKKCLLKLEQKGRKAEGL